MGQRSQADNHTGGTAPREDREHQRATPRYRRLFFLAVSSSCLVSLSPLFIMALINYYQYHNAFAAVEDGGEVGIKISRAGEERVAVHIRDNGSGISDQNLSKIFDPFFTTKEKYGTGLGLSITYGIIAKLGGQILVDSSEGVFTEFTVLLPVRTELKGGDDGKAQDQGIAG